MSRGSRRTGVEKTAMERSRWRRNDDTASTLSLLIASQAARLSASLAAEAAAGSSLYCPPKK